MMRPTPLALLRLLSDGRPWTVARLAQALGSGETRAVQALSALERGGIPVIRKRGRGVSLAAPADLLDAAAAGAALRRAGAPVTLEIADECASTNADLLARAAAGAPGGIALACEVQTAGRGRRGNPWVAPLAGGLAFSLLWRMDRGTAGLAGLSLAAGVACIRALERVGVRGAGLKWPNDIVHAGGKLGGILVEAVGEARGATAVVCGVGLNTRLGEEARRAIGQPVVDVASLSETPPTRNALLVASLIELAATMQAFADAGFAVFREPWLRSHAHQGERVRLLLGSERVVEGRALGVADDGALLLDRDGRVESFHAGEVSLRRAA